MKFAADKGFSGDKFNAISLGQGQVFPFSTLFSVRNYMQTKLGLFILANVSFDVIWFLMRFLNCCFGRCDAEMCHAFLPTTKVTVCLCFVPGPCGCSAY